MYSKELIDSIIESARDVIDNNNKKYNPLMAIIETFIHKHDLILLPSTNKYFFNLYTHDIFYLAKELTNLLYDSGDPFAKYATLIIKINKYHSRIILNGVQFVHFTYLGSDIRKNILEYTCPGLFSDLELQCFGPEIRLINIYYELTCPLYLNNWDLLVESENILSTELSKNFSERIIGSAESPKTIESPKYADSTNECAYLGSADMHKILALCTRKDTILIGAIATSLYIGNSKHYGRYQIITELKIQDLIDILSPDFKDVTYGKIHCNVPINLKLQKTTIYSERIPIVDVYNAANFEMVPFILYSELKTKSKDDRLYTKVQLGTPFVCLRFRLIDIWSTAYAVRAKLIKKETALVVVQKLINDYINLKKSTTAVFSTKYIGLLENPILSRERLAVRLKEYFIPPYMPYKKQKDSQKDKESEKV